MARILVVDDEPSVTAVLSEMLICAGHEVLLANDLPQGFELTKSQSPDLALVDIEMPAGEPAGLDLLKQIKKHNPSIAVMMITGVASKRRIVAAMREGAQDFIEKPFSFHEISKRIDTALLQQKTAWAY